ncbi:hypothetical protein GCM10025876_39010 [Demequina litorisediminis]|uniref:3-dehydroquinate dehydratase n=1 Tax=Demequina litorisediminis TaxID=1849022 RepID=A0ABQ6IKL7_9MICO|nr:hypothetical protein GCM10025876_39010 [Demequina litorisediminis]
MTTVLVANGPNLGRLGSREPEKYGTTTFDEIAALCMQWGSEHGLEAVVRQTDDEAEPGALDASGRRRRVARGAEPGRLHPLQPTRCATPARWSPARD